MSQLPLRDAIGKSRSVEKQDCQGSRASAARGCFHLGSGVGSAGFLLFEGFRAVIVVFGSINLDLIFSLRNLPQPGQTLLASGMTMEAGGKGANQALAAARDGATVIMAGAVGRDSFADVALAGLRDAAVDLTRVVRTEAPTGFASIATDQAGRNQIIVASGANMLARADQVGDDLLTPATTLVLQMEVAEVETAALIRRARAHAARIILNLAPARALDPEILRMLDILIVNEDEAGWLAAELAVPGDARSLQKELGVTVVRTLGAEGAEAAGPLEYWRIPALKIDAVNSTAAGDCFTGVLAAALDAGRPLPAAMTRAVAAAGLCCTRRGSQASLPSAGEIDRAA